MNRILQLTGLIGTFLLFCGVLKFYLYYKEFNLSILKFLDLQEIVTLFMDNLIAYFAIIVPTSICFFLFYKNIEPDILDNSINSFQILVNQWELILVFIILGIVGGLFYFLITKGVTKNDLYLIFLLVIICFIAIPFFYIIIKRGLMVKFNTPLLFEDLILFFLGALLLGYSILTAFNEVKKVKKSHYYEGVAIIFKDTSSITSTKTNYFIGMTKNYLFVYNDSTKSSTAYRTDELKSIKFP